MAYPAHSPGDGKYYHRHPRLFGSGRFCRAVGSGGSYTFGLLAQCIVYSASNREITVGFRYGLPMKCATCGQDKDESEFYITSRKKRYMHCKKCTSDITWARQRQNKLKAVEYLGGKCKKCGYDKSVYALTFHHRDPELKDKNFKHSRGWSWERLKKELDKCDLLCHNCHAETHEEIFNGDHSVMVSTTGCEPVSMDSNSIGRPK